MVTVQKISDLKSANQSARTIIALNEYFVSIGAKLAAEIEDNSLNTNSFACGDSSRTPLFFSNFLK